MNTARVRKFSFIKRIIVILLLAGCAIIGILLAWFYSTRDSKYTNTANFSKKVFIKKENGRYSLYKNGHPFFVKGGSGFTHIPELAACGGNTVIVWDTSKIEATLNESQKYNVSVLIGLDVPGGNFKEFYKDEQKIAALFRAYKNIVLRYRAHPAVLAWCLGNEAEMPFSLSSRFYGSFKDLLKMIHTEDPDHPVTTTIMSYQKHSIININLRIRDIDFISINTYNRLKEMDQQLAKVMPVWNGPFLVTEWSPNGGWESENTTWQAPIENTSTKKAEQFAEFYKMYMPKNNPRFLGSMAYYWGSREEYTHTWFSVFNDDGTPTEVKEVLNDCWKDTATIHQSVKIKYMLIDSLGARDNIILNPRSTHQVSLILADGQPADSLTYYWEILTEDWLHWDRTWNNFKKPAALHGLLTDSTKQKSFFTCPAKEGPYRVFITVFNNKGYCATANTPFYVLE